MDINVYYGVIDKKITCKFLHQKREFNTTYTLQQLKALDMNNKEIIGYKLKEKIEGFCTEIGEICKDSRYFPLYKDHPKFEPVYKEEKQLPTTLGYKGEDLKGEIKYGCRRFTTLAYYDLYNTLQNFGIESYKIPQGEVKTSEIKQIVDYIKEQR